MATPEHGPNRTGLHLLGFGTVRQALARIAVNPPPVKLLPGSNSYFNMIGKIWMQELGGHYPRTGGQVAIFLEPPMLKEGNYFNRV